MKSNLRRKDLIYPELSYQIIGILFEVYNRLGPGYHEKYYQRAIAAVLRECRIPFQEQVYVSLIFKGEKIGSYYLDFLITDKMILEIKKGERFSKRNIDQILTYLKAKKLKLGIIANFGQRELKFRRIINFDS
jgi:GxxExxY protein